MRGGRTGRPCAPSPAAGARRKPGGARAGRRLAPGPAARAPILPVAPFCLCRRTVASWKAAFTALCIPRALLPALSCSCLRQVSAWRLLPPPLTLREGGFVAGKFATSPLTFGPMARV